MSMPRHLVCIDRDGTTGFDQYVKDSQLFLAFVTCVGVLSYDPAEIAAWPESCCLPWEVQLDSPPLQPARLIPVGLCGTQ